jgi:hypothetical protein
MQIIELPRLEQTETSTIKSNHTDSDYQLNWELYSLSALQIKFTHDDYHLLGDDAVWLL